MWAVEGAFQAEGAGCAKALRLVCPRNPTKAGLTGASKGCQAMCLERGAEAHLVGPFYFL